MAHRLLAIVTSDPLGPESLREIRAGNGSEGTDLRVVVPAVEANPLRHTLGDIDEPRQEAEARLGRVLGELRENGIEAGGEVGDPDPIQAAQDALLKAPADEIVIFEHEQAQARWFEEGLLEKAEAGLEPPLRMVVLHSDRDGASTSSRSRPPALAPTIRPRATKSAPPTFPASRAPISPAWSPASSAPSSPPSSPPRLRPTTAA